MTSTGKVLATLRQSVSRDHPVVVTASSNTEVPCVLHGGREEIKLSVIPYQR